jgi:hypothetical protein
MRSITSRILIASATLIFCIGIGQAQSSSQGGDGFDWNKATQSWKLGYVTGFIDAASWAGGNVDGAVSVLKSLSPEDRRILTEGKKVLDYYNIPYVQLIDGMNDFYADNLNKAIKWGRALSYVRDCIHGERKEYLENELNFERKLATQN